MNITFEELRNVKHSLPTGSVSRIASELNMSEQTVRNYFGARDFDAGRVVPIHLEPGPNGGIVHLEDDRIFNLAQKIIQEKQNHS